MTRRKIIVNASKLFDLLVMVVSFGIANLPVLIKVGPVSFAEFLSIRVKLRNLLIFVVLLWVWNSLFTLLGMYDSKRMSSRRDEVMDIIKATSLGTLAITVVAFLLNLRMISPGFITVFWLSTTGVGIASRLVLRIWLRHIRIQGRNLRNMLIVGTNRRAIEFVKTIQSQPELGYRILGFCDGEWGGLSEISTLGFSVLCDLSTLPAFLRRNVVDEVVLALPLRSFHSQASNIAALCEQQGIIVRLLSDLFNLKNARPRAEDLDGAPLIAHYTTAVDGWWPMLAKRTLDFAVALTLLTLLAPFLLVIAVWIKWTSPGPVLFVQKRVGLSKRTFNIYKFRTMIVDAENKLENVMHLNEVSGPVFKIKNDPRLTPIGRFLRKTSIDELPQLLNVLQGDMSLVGPRPLPLRDFEGFDQDWHRRRFSVRPGITCLWQINGRSSVPFEKWMELDMQYVDKWSLWLDLKILARTIPAVLKGSGAA